MVDKKRIIKILIGLIVYILGIFIVFPKNEITLLIFIISYIIVGGDVVVDAIKNVVKGNMLDENFLMSIATIGAFAIGEYHEAVAVMLFFQVGELFQDYAVNKSRKSIKALLEIKPEFANLKIDNEIKKVDPSKVEVDSIIVVKPFEKIPLDGIIIEGTSSLNTSNLTGESLPVDVFKDSEVLSGCVNLSGVITIKTTKSFKDSTVSKILELVENASARKSNSEKFITKFARVYTPLVVGCSFLLAIIPTIFFAQDFSVWLYRALTFLVISCPCALVISIPLGFFGGIGASSKEGILIKGSNFLEALSSTEIVVFDKTGTLTKGIFVIQEIVPKNIEKEELLKLATYGEIFSSHPISEVIKKENKEEIDLTLLDQAEELPGYGTKVLYKNEVLLVGNSKLMDKFKIEYDNPKNVGTVVHIGYKNEYLGYILINDQIKDDSKMAIKNLKGKGIKDIYILTGDNKEVAKDVSEKLDVEKIYSELLPHDKLKILEDLFARKTKKGKIIYVGDGINDAPVLARADVGFAMGGVGSDVAVETADVVIMTDEPSKVAKAIEISKKTLKIVKQNIIFVLTIKILVLLLGAGGLFSMWEAVFADVGVALLCILNSMKVMK
ncbi:MAG: heavy metal translocating P-type ATPase [Lachnospirales bacterium]